MKICIVLASLCFCLAAAAQKQTKFEAFAEDSLHKELLGNWYLSGTYTFDLRVKHDYLSAPNGNFELRITKDSIEFIQPAERFNKLSSKHRYKLKFEDHYMGQTINLLEPKSKKTIKSQFHFELFGDELILTEVLTSAGFTSLDISRQFVFNRYFDPLQLEPKLQFTWSTDDIKNMDYSKSSDTITFNKVIKANYSEKYVMEIHREASWLLSAYVTSSISNSNNEGVFVREKNTVILHPRDQEIEFVTSKGNYFFKIISIDDSKLVLMKPHL